MTKKELLDRLKGISCHRRSAAGGAWDISTSSKRILDDLNFIAIYLYQMELERCLKDCKQFYIAWDPSGSNNVAVISTPMLDDFAGFLPIQSIDAITVEEVSDDFKALVAAQKCSKLESLNELRSMSAALSTVNGIGANMFILSEEIVIARAVREHEVKVRLNNGTTVFCNSLTGECRPETTLTADEMLNLPFLISTSDRGPLPQAVTNFLSYGCSALFDSRP